MHNLFSYRTSRVLLLAAVPVAAGVAGAALLATIPGTPGNDKIDSTWAGEAGPPTNAADAINGLAGNDRIWGYGGNDTIDGGDGVDAIYGGEGDDVLAGRDGIDTIEGGPGDDAVAGDQGNDNIKGEAGDDTLDGGDGNDRIWGGPGNDVIAGREDNDTLQGNGGDDVITGDNGDDEIIGGYGGGSTPDRGNLKLYGGNDNDVIDARVVGRHELFGEAGNDRLIGAGDADKLDGGGGDDTLDGGAGEDLLHGGEGNDDLTASNSGIASNYDKPEGYGLDEDGNARILMDTLYGDAGDDLLRGGGNYGLSNEGYYLDGGIEAEGSDTLVGANGFDFLVGRGGNDVLLGGGNYDHFIIIGNSVQGYEIYDVFTGTYGEDDFEPSDSDVTNVPSHDVLFFAKDVNPQQATIEFSGDTDKPQPEWNTGLRTDQPVTFAFSDLPRGGDIECVITGSASDTVTGTDRPGTRNVFGTRLGNLYVGDVILTGPGNDTVNTNGGADLVQTGEGNDTINANGDGTHYLLTGPGEDTINLAADGFADLDEPIRIADFSVTDEIVLQGIADADAVALANEIINDRPGVAVTVDQKVVIHIYQTRTRNLELVLRDGNVVIRTDRDIIAPPPFGEPDRDREPGPGGPPKGPSPRG
jgi:Ca2+-binding RTX toxin-like protein